MRMGEQKANIDLFPILPSDKPVYTGIARMAAHSGHLDAGHLVEFRSLEPRSILNRSISKRRIYFGWSINPYRGCEFGCRYCYARYTHEFMELRDPADFERQIYIKQNAAWLLRQELHKMKPGAEIAIGTATDPYQPIERKAKVTRSLLEVFAETAGFWLGIVTKSTLIVRDIDLLKQIARRHALSLHVTITTPDMDLARILEPRAPRPDLRFRTVARLRAAGLRVGILNSPLMPGITDTKEALDRMAEYAKKAHASFLSAQPLFLKPCSKETFMNFIRQHFPELEEQYTKRYDTSAFVSKAYQQRMAALVGAVIRKHGLHQRFTEGLLTGDTAVEAAARIPEQGELWPEPEPKPVRARAESYPIERKRSA